MKIAYLSNSTIPSSHANSIHVMQMCNAFAENGHEVTLFCRFDKSASVESALRFYDVNGNFNIKNSIWPKVPCGGMFYGLQVLLALRRQTAQADLLYARCLYSAFLARHLGIPLIYECHALPRTRFHWRLQASVLASKHLRGLVVISNALRRDCESVFPSLCSRVPVVVEPDAAPFANPVPEGEYPTFRSNGENVVRIVYTGSLLPGKGVETVIALARRCPRYQFHILGGLPDVRAAQQKQDVPVNLHHHGFLPPAETRCWQAEADILLLPNQREVLADKGRVDIGRWTSPLKMFEYMASGVPLIASDLPILREVLVAEHNCLMAPPDDIPAWSKAIERLVKDPELGRRLAANARAEVAGKHNWPARAERILRDLVPTVTAGA